MFYISIEDTTSNGITVVRESYASPSFILTDFFLEYSSQRALPDSLSRKLASNHVLVCSTITWYQTLSRGNQFPLGCECSRMSSRVLRFDNWPVNLHTLVLRIFQTVRRYLNDSPLPLLFLTPFFSNFPACSVGTYATDVKRTIACNGKLTALNSLNSRTILAVSRIRAKDVFKICGKSEFVPFILDCPSGYFQTSTGGTTCSSKFYS